MRRYQRVVPGLRGDDGVRRGCVTGTQPWHPSLSCSPPVSQPAGPTVCSQHPALGNLPGTGIARDNTETQSTVLLQECSAMNEKGTGTTAVEQESTWPRCPVAPSPCLVSSAIFQEKVWCFTCQKKHQAGRHKLQSCLCFLVLTR